LLKRNWKIVFVGISLLFDLCAIGLAALAVEGTRHWGIFPTHATVESLRLGGTVFAVVFVALGIMMGVYRGSFHQSLRLQMLQMTRKYVYSVLFSLAVVSFLNSVQIDRHALTVFFSSLFFALVISKVSLRGVNRLFQRFGLGVHPSLVVGEDENAAMIFERFASLPDLGYQMKGFITKKRNPGNGLHPLYHYDELDTIIKRKSIDRIFIPSTEMVANGYAFLRDVSNKHRIKLKVLSPQSEQLLGIARVYDIAGITLMSPPRQHIDAAKRFLKRVFDIVGSICIILVLSPVFAVTIVSIYFETGRPFFFLQKRSSIKGGKEFYFIKFRSMINNADELKQDMFHHNQSDGALFKMKDDPRVTKVGRVIRKYSIDELPQLFNVLKGDMSLVGPRPLPVSDFCKAKEPDEFWEAVKDRASVKPGMTGLWQISGRSDIKFKDMILLDLYYVENYSLLFDLEILFETIPAVVFGKGAY
jgi:exopolysaccharide biosynthesis polyprenyl glycosylphosphotransferase